MKRAVVPISIVILALALLGCGPAVKDKRVVQMNYTLTLPDGSVYVTSIGEGKEPLEFMVGAGEMFPALEKELIGLRAKAKKTVVVKAADGYGDYVDDAVQETPRAELPPDMELEIGKTFNISTPAGPMPITVKSLTDKTVVWDLNHPLAGKDLTFDVQIMKVRDATKEELATRIQEESAEPLPED